MKPALLLFWCSVRGLFCYPLVRPSFDEQGMPWEFMGDNSFLRYKATTRCLTVAQLSTFFSDFVHRHTTKCAAMRHPCLDVDEAYSLKKFHDFPDKVPCRGQINQNAASAMPHAAKAYRVIHSISRQIGVSESDRQGFATAGGRFFHKIHEFPYPRRSRIPWFPTRPPMISQPALRRRLNRAQATGAP
ncbi:hypothetical protein [Ponticoccus alexandrii]|uniref:Secreted protein n=1 Tax=Ponticoccus alexandrii TaxID=1943633 RepID=A0ABX7FC26_9RHOB|nr:hypothetical protein [Ponticoccus alexandrii]QRF67119.1 hypothetical protein GQA70_12855 [Ponticoccus alexandrii]